MRSRLVLKYGRNGPFLSCSRYPECSNAVDFKRDEHGRLIPHKQEATPSLESARNAVNPWSRKKANSALFWPVPPIRLAKTPGR
jgi:DNA topoisomerase-1